MRFTYEAYADLLRLLAAEGYSIVGYGDHLQGRKEVILRHDVDIDLEKAAAFAAFEQQAQVTSTYFILVRSDLYNIFSTRSIHALDRIMAAGHEIGLHFDDTCYPESADIAAAVQREKRLLEEAVGAAVKCVSMHRPSQRILDADYRFAGLANSYSQEYYHQWKYVSDSRMRWREDVTRIVASGQYRRIQILTHPFWYAQSEESTREKLRRFMMHAAIERYDAMEKSFTDLSEFVQREEIACLSPFRK